jgi:hypothetical protein
LERTAYLEERLYLGVLELVIARLARKADGWVQGKEMRGVVGDNTDKLRREFSDISQAAEPERIIESRNKGREKRVRAAPECIVIQPEILVTSHDWADTYDWKKTYGKIEKIGLSCGSESAGVGT